MILTAKVVPRCRKITGDANVQTQKVAGTNEVIIKTKTLDVRAETAVRIMPWWRISAWTQSKITAESISSTVSTEMRKDAVMAVVIATVLMLLYIWFRFKDIRFASQRSPGSGTRCAGGCWPSTPVARVSVGNTFIACMLTIVGYSINATIVIFDRIRENMAVSRKKADLEELVNNSITQTLTRSIYTSLTTFIMVFLLFVLGVSSVREFALPLMVGIVCGGYSSVCITGALWYVMKTKIKKKMA
ncbi:MAG: protein translocase subunit SecF [Blautia sp.]